MKKILSFIVILSMCFSLFAMGGGESATTENGEDVIEIEFQPEEEIERILQVGSLNLRLVVCRRGNLNNVALLGERNFHDPGYSARTANHAATNASPFQPEKERCPGMAHCGQCAVLPGDGAGPGRGVLVFPQQRPHQIHLRVPVLLYPDPQHGTGNPGGVGHFHPLHRPGKHPGGGCDHLLSGGYQHFPPGGGGAAGQRRNRAALVPHQRHCQCGARSPAGAGGCGGRGGGSGHSAAGLCDVLGWQPHFPDAVDLCADLHSVCPDRQAAAAGQAAARR